jgi:hypothetical protein
MDSVDHLGLKLGTIHTVGVDMASKAGGISGVIPLIIGLLLIIFCRRLGSAWGLGVSRGWYELLGKNRPEASQQTYGSKADAVLSAALVFVVGLVFVGIGVAELTSVI